MKYCENCHAATDAERCPLCKGRKLREVAQEDYCLLTELPAMNGEMLADVLRGNGIGCVTLPTGSGLNSALALPLENRRLFVQWKFWETAKRYLQEEADEETQSLRRYILDNAQRLYLSPKLTKKVFKKSRGACGDDAAAYCRDLIAKAERIYNGGPSCCSANGDDLICFTGGISIVVASETFEILSVSFSKR